MRRAAHDGPSLEPFFAGLRDEILAAWQSQPGYAYDRVIYAVSYPYCEEDIGHVLSWCGRSSERALLPPVEDLNRMMEDHDYPHHAGLAPAGVSPQAWSAVLHFCDPSYAVYTEEAARALAAMGFGTSGAGGALDYTSFLEAVDELKVEAPVTSIPETNWYLARNIGVGLEGWLRSHAAPAARASGGSR